MKPSAKMDEGVKNPGLDTKPSLKLCTEQLTNALQNKPKDLKDKKNSAQLF